MSKGPAKTIEDITKGFAKHQYICSEQISTAVYLANELEKPMKSVPPWLFITGESKPNNIAPLYNLGSSFEGLFSRINTSDYSENPDYSL